MFYAFPEKHSNVQIIKLVFLFFAEWEDFKRIFNKTYTNQIEEKKRQQIFVHNEEVVAAHNRLFERGMATYSLAINKFSDWTYNEVLGMDLSSLASNQKELVTYSLDDKATEAIGATEYESRQKGSKGMVV